MRIVKVGESYICPVCGKYTFEYTVIVQLPFSVWVYLQRCRIASLEPVLWWLSTGRSRGLSVDAEKMRLKFFR